jgi:hypothetical protein
MIFAIPGWISASCVNRHLTVFRLRLDLTIHGLRVRLPGFLMNPTPAASTASGSVETLFSETRPD